MDIYILITGIAAYLIGAIPTGYLIAKLKGITDIREHGSGNIGATNVSRMLGKHYFFLIFLLDAGKAYLFISAIKNHFDFSYLCFFASILLLGNCYSIFLRGSGGKGVATLCGLLGALHLQTLMIVLGIWFIALLLTRTVGIASVISIALLPVIIYITTDNNVYFVFFIYDHSPLYLFSLFASTLVLWRHKTNIRAYFWKRQ